MKKRFKKFIDKIFKRWGYIPVPKINEALIIKEEKYDMERLTVDRIINQDYYTDCIMTNEVPMIVEQEQKRMLKDLSEGILPYVEFQSWEDKMTGNLRLKAILFVGRNNRKH